MFLSGARGRRRCATFGWCAVVLFGAAMALPGAAWAHDPGLSSVTLLYGGARLEVRAIFTSRDINALLSLDAAADGAVSAAELEAAGNGLRPLAASLFAVRGSVDSSGEPILLAGRPLDIRSDDSGAIHFSIAFEIAAPQSLTLLSLRLEDLGLGHRQLVTVRSESGAVLAETLLDAKRNRVSLAGLDQIAPPKVTRPGGAFAGFVGLGIEHILIGYDHLAFLIALLLIGSSFGEAAKTISSFTVAHSITLGLASLDLVRLPIGAVEALIALSIVYVGIENLLGGGVERRWMIAFGFGLIHGFGFASVLRELTAGTGAAIIGPLLGFNVGVELGQIVVAAVVLPVVWHLRHRPAFVTRYAPACSLLIVLAGCYWFLERTF